MTIHGSRTADGVLKSLHSLALHRSAAIAFASLFLTMDVSTVALPSVTDVTPFVPTPPLLSCNGDTPGFCPDAPFNVTYAQVIAA